MNLFYHVLGLTCVLVLLFFLIRWQISINLHATLGKHSRKKRFKEQTFFEWVTYKRFKDVLPTSTFIWYYGHLLAYPVLVILVIIFDIFNLPYKVGGMLILAYFAFSAIPLITSNTK